MPDVALRDDDLVLDPASLEKLGHAMEEDELDLGVMDKTATDFVFDAGWRPLELRVPGRTEPLKADVDLVTGCLIRSAKTTSGYRLKSREHLVHFNPDDKKAKVFDPDKCVEYQGDSTDGTESEQDTDPAADKDGPDEATHIFSGRVADDVERLVMLLNIHKEAGDPPIIQKLTFDQIARCFARIYPLGKEHLAEVFQLTQLAKGADTIVLGYFDRVRDANGKTIKWKFVRVMAYAESLLDALVPYGMRKPQS